MRTIQSSIILFLFTSFFALAQENDFQTWNSISINKKILKKTTLSFKTGIRLRENSRLYSKQFFDIKFRKKINKNFSFSLGYRYINKFNTSFILSIQNRSYFDVNYKIKIPKRFSLSLRNRCQFQGYINDYSLLFRQKYSLSYNLKKTKLTPGISTEYFLDFKDGFKKLRSTFSLGYPFAKNLDFELAYRIQNEFYTNNPQTLFIFEGKLAYDL